MIADAHPGVRKIGTVIGWTGKNGTFLAGVLTLTLSDLFLGVNYYVTILDGVPDTPLLSNWWLVSFFTMRFVVGTLISAMFSTGQMIGINMVIKKMKWSSMEPIYRLGAIFIAFIFLIDFYFNVGGSAMLTGGVQAGNVLPIQADLPNLAFCVGLAFLASFGTLLMYLFLDIGEPMTKRGREEAAATGVFDQDA